jgi:hypothetical protein
MSIIAYQALVSMKILFPDIELILWIEISVMVSGNISKMTLPKPREFQEDLLLRVDRGFVLSREDLDSDSLMILKMEFS